MLCIAAFIVLFFCGIFSAAYRQMAKKAWHCVLRRLTFRPCDINFSEEVRGRLLGRIILTHPRLARFTDRWIDAVAWVFVALSVWSLAAVSLAGLNLLVYDTCSPADSEGCSLSGDACSIASYKPGFWELVRKGQPQQWFVTEAKTLAGTISMIPARFKNWKPEDYITADNSWYYPFDSAKPIALEILDPGCHFCADLLGNIHKAGFESHYNLTYIAFPIPDPAMWSGYKFGESWLIATYLEAMKQIAPARRTSRVAPDWLLLEKIFTGTDASGLKWQENFDTRLDPDQARAAIAGFCAEIGYSREQQQQITELAGSPAIAARIRAQQAIVEERIRTVKIPTILFGGRRYDRVLSPERLR